VFEGECPQGFVKAENLVRVLTTYGIEKLSEEQAQDLVNQLEVDSNGLINYSVYVDMMMT
jgi:calmodulin